MTRVKGRVGSGVIKSLLLDTLQIGVIDLVHDCSLPHICLDRDEGRVRERAGSHRNQTGYFHSLLYLEECYLIDYWKCVQTCVSLVSLRSRL